MLQNKHMFSNSMLKIKIPPIIYSRLTHLGSGLLWEVKDWEQLTLYWKKQKLEELIMVPFRPW